MPEQSTVVIERHDVWVIELLPDGVTDWQFVKLTFKEESAYAFANMMAIDPRLRQLKNCKRRIRAATLIFKDEKR